MATGITRRALLQRGAALGAAAALPVSVPIPVLGSSAADDPTLPDLGFLETDFAGSLRSFFATMERALAANPVDLPRLMQLADAGRDGTLSGTEAKELQRLRLAAVRQGRAVGEVMGFFLRFSPYPMLAEVRARGPVYQPAFGPVLVVHGDAVRDVLSRHETFSVVPYGVEMRKVMTPAHNGGFDSFILGTDVDSEYDPDRRLLDSVCLPEDAGRIATLVHDDCRRRVGLAVETARAADAARIEVVTALARFVPITVGHRYLGVPVADATGSFVLTPEMLTYYGAPIDGQAETALGPFDGIVPDEATMYDWTVSAFRHFFNNPQRDPQVRARGLRACRLLLCHILREIDEQKRRLAASEPAADTMLGRLVLFQAGHASPTASPPPGLEPERLNDLRIAEQLMGTIVGAVAGQEKAACRIIDAMVSLKEGVYASAGTPGLRYGSFEEARSFALNLMRGVDVSQSRAALHAYAMEALRLKPQSEVLVRQCMVDEATIADSRPIAAGTPILASHASSMQEVPEPEGFVLDRPPEVYLHHGWQRHICLGRYVSRMMLVETMAAVLALEGLSRPAPRPGESAMPFEGRLGRLQLGEDNLYATSFTLDFADTGTTAELWPARR